MCRMSRRQEEIMYQKIHNIGFIIKTLDSAVMRRTLDLIPEEEKLPIMQGWIINYLYDHQEKEIFQKDIERNFHIARSTVTCMVKQMEKEGFIARVGVERDSRLKKIILLKKGEELHELIRGRLSGLEMSMKEGISEEEMEAFFKVAFRILDNLGGSGCDSLTKERETSCFTTADQTGTGRQKMTNQSLKKGCEVHV